MRVRVYRNLRAGGYSVLNPRTGRVVGHASAVLLTAARFIVREGGRKRVLEERRKNVHAFVEGDLIDATPLDGRRCPSGRGGGAWGVDATAKRLGP